MSLSATMRSSMMMPGLEDLAHAAFAQGLEQDIRAQREILAGRGEDLFDLVGREPFAPHQHLGRRTRIGILRLHVGGDELQLRRLQQVAPTKQVNQRGDACHAHVVNLGLAARESPGRHTEGGQRKRRSHCGTPRFRAVSQPCDRTSGKAAHLVGLVRSPTHSPPESPVFRMVSSRLLLCLQDADGNQIAVPISRSANLASQSGGAILLGDVLVPS